MTINSTPNVLRIRDFVRGLRGFEVPNRASACYNHIGATLCDTILQAGLNYRTVVRPRVQNIIRRWPTARSTSKFLLLISRHGLNGVLAWQHPEKPIRICKLAEFLAGHDLETEGELSQWLRSDGNCESLRGLRGVGPKTVDYLKSLVGVPTVAVDRHVRTFVRWAGIDATGYDEIRELVCMAADTLKIERHAFDHAIWNYVSTRQLQAA
jgi:endonuclease III